jgi:L-threonylcarbamoyladenylate synthase
MTIISNNIDRAAEILQQGDLVAIPTETVYGLAGNIYNESAIRKIFEVKQRPLFNPLIVHLHSVEQVSEIASHIPEKAMQLAEAFWPGSLTLVLSKKDIIPDLITAGKDTVAMRIPNHPVTQELLRKLPFPLAAPSANPFNRISPTSAKHVESYFKDSIRMVLDGGECKKGLESTIIGFEGDEPVLYRLGSISKEEIEEIVGKVQVKNKKESAPSAPGMLEKHYAPRTKTILVDSVDDINISTEGKRVGLLSLTKVDNSEIYNHVEILSENGDMAEAAANLYKALHKLDSHDLDIIIAVRMPDKGLGRSINDRLERAAK